MSKENIFRTFAVFSIGIIIGLLCGILLDTSDSMNSMECTCAEEFETAAVRLDELLKEIFLLRSDMNLRLLDVMENLNGLRSAIELNFQEQDKTESPSAVVAPREIIPPSSPTEEPTQIATATDSGWVSVLDKDLAKVMVEEGVTPFDDCIRPAMKTVLTQLDEVESQYRAAEKDAMSRFDHSSKTKKDAKDYLREEDRLKKQRQKDREYILSDFRATIESLRALEKEGK